MHESLSYIYEGDFRVFVISVLFSVYEIYERTPGSSLSKTLWSAMVCCTGMLHCAEGLLSAARSSCMGEDNSSFPLSNPHWTHDIMMIDIYAIELIQPRIPQTSLEIEI